MQQLNNNHGSVYIEYLIGFFGIMLCVAFAMAVLPIFTTRTTLDNTATQIMRVAELSGNTNQTALITELQEETGLAFTADWSGTDWIAGTTRVQLGDDIHLTLTVTESISLYEFGSFPVTIKTTLWGVSEVYRK